MAAVIELGLTSSAFRQSPGAVHHGFRHPIVEHSALNCQWDTTMGTPWANIVSRTQQGRSRHSVNGFHNLGLHTG
jgi:hypothetical protein